MNYNILKIQNDFFFFPKKNVSEKTLKQRLEWFSLFSPSSVTGIRYPINPSDAYPMVTMRVVFSVQGDTVHVEITKKGARMRKKREK